MGRNKIREIVTLHYEWIMSPHYIKRNTTFYAVVYSFECEKWFGEILVFGKLPLIAVNGLYDHDIVISGYKKW